MGEHMAYPVLAIVAAATVQAAAPPPLALTCLGAGTANKGSAVTVHTNTEVSGMVGTTIVSGSDTGTSTVFIPRHEGYSDQVDIRLFSGDDKIRLPRTTLPLFHGGAEGWFRLKKVVADVRAIRAEAVVNFMNHPKIYIDRVTGTISISGKGGNYSGQCEVIDANAPAKF